MLSMWRFFIFDYVFINSVTHSEFSLKIPLKSILQLVNFFLTARTVAATTACTCLVLKACGTPCFLIIFVYTVRITPLGVGKNGPTKYAEVSCVGFRKIREKKKDK